MGEKDFSSMNFTLSWFWPKKFQDGHAHHILETCTCPYQRISKVETILIVLKRTMRCMDRVQKMKSMLPGFLTAFSYVWRKCWMVLEVDEISEPLGDPVASTGRCVNSQIKAWKTIFL